MDTSTGTGSPPQLSRFGQRLEFPTHPPLSMCKCSRERAMPVKFRFVCLIHLYTISVDSSEGTVSD